MFQRHPSSSIGGFARNVIASSISSNVTGLAFAAHDVAIAHTIFHGARKPLIDWFWANFLVATRTMGSAPRLQHELSLSYQTTWTLCHKIHAAMEGRDNRYNLLCVVELHDDLTGKKKA